MNFMKKITAILFTIVSLGLMAQPVLAQNEQKEKKIKILKVIGRVSACVYLASVAAAVVVGGHIALQVASKMPVLKMLCKITGTSWVMNALRINFLQTNKSLFWGECALEGGLVLSAISLGHIAMPLIRKKIRAVNAETLGFGLNQDIDDEDYKK